MNGLGNYAKSTNRKRLDVQGRVPKKRRRNPSTDLRLGSNILVWTVFAIYSSNGFKHLAHGSCFLELLCYRIRDGLALE